MKSKDKDFIGSIPQVYDKYLVPLIFESCAKGLVDRVQAFGPSSILETAAGSGVVIRELAPRLATESTVMVTDLNQPMLDQAARMLKPDTRISWQQADALKLPFGDASFDIVMCQFGIMFYPDRITGYSEAQRVLKPGGAMVFNVWDRIETNEFADEVALAAASVFPDDPPRFLQRVPHGYHDENLIRKELHQAGFKEPAFESFEAISAAPSAYHPAVAYCQGTPLRNEIEERDPDLLEHVTDCASMAISKRFGTGPVSAGIKGIVITAFA
jgi:ubiquinone/menaquinone biosynthesis C-methylase UbiE